jgi:hypothetical protein
MWREIAQPFAESTPVLSGLAAALVQGQDRERLLDDEQRDGRSVLERA